MLHIIAKQHSPQSRALLDMLLPTLLGRLGTKDMDIELTLAGTCKQSHSNQKCLLDIEATCRDVVVIVQSCVCSDLLPDLLSAALLCIVRSNAYSCLSSQQVQSLCVVGYIPLMSCGV